MPPLVGRKHGPTAVSILSLRDTDSRPVMACDMAGAYPDDSWWQPRQKPPAEPGADAWRRWPHAGVALHVASLRDTDSHGNTGEASGTLSCGEYLIRCAPRLNIFGAKTGGKRGRQKTYRNSVQAYSFWPPFVLGFCVGVAEEQKSGR
jgi:hypothetical protein